MVCCDALPWVRPGRAICPPAHGAGHIVGLVVAHCHLDVLEDVGALHLTLVVEDGVTQQRALNKHRTHEDRQVHVATIMSAQRKDRTISAREARGVGRSVWSLWCPAM
jgi:hypothetical protein